MESFKQFLDVAVNIFVLVGGVWAFYLVFWNRTIYWNIQMELSSEILGYQDKTRILNIKICLKNLSRTCVEADNKKGCAVSVYKIPDDLKVGSPIEKAKCIPLISNLNVLRRYEEINDIEYEMEPGIEFHEIEPVIVEKGGAYLISSEFFVDTKTWWRKRLWGRDPFSVEEFLIVRVD